MSESYLGRKTLKLEHPFHPPAAGQPHSSADQRGRKPHLINMTLGTAAGLHQGTREKGVTKYLLRLEATLIKRVRGNVSYLMLKKKLQNKIKVIA